MKKLRYETSSDYDLYRERILDLHKLSYGSVSEALYDSLYRGNPYGPPLLGLCFDGDRLVGQENYIRQDVAATGHVWKGALGINTLVDPGYRLFYGVFGELCRLTIKRLEGEVDLLCAYANEDSKAYYLKYFQWRIASRVRVYKKATRVTGLNAESLLSLLGRRGSGRAVGLEHTGRFDPSVLDPILEGYLREARHAYFFKTARFLNWRYLDNSHYRARGYYVCRDQRVCGYCVTWDDREEKKIVDILVEGDDPGTFLGAMGRLAALSMSQGLRRLMLYATRGCWYEGLIRKALFIPRWEFDFITRDLNGRGLQMPWVLHIGDFDIF